MANAAAEHEIDEALGWSSSLNLAAGTPPKPADHFRYEYDGLGDTYARFLLEELLPHIAADQKLNLSANPNDRAIAGSSSGGICAFTAAWERPNAFRRVFTSVGTYVGLRGGNVYPTLIRKTEPKPLRVFLQDGSHDQDIYGGNWFLANQVAPTCGAFI
jgi:enterochelin esterase-like enzyme